MTNDSIEALIDLLNARVPPTRARDRIFIRPMTDEVDFAHVWHEEPRGGIGLEGSYEFYFIKDGSQQYVAAVLDMHSDLHAFTKEAHRKGGHISRALNSVILPKFWQEGRKTQKVTYQDQEAAPRLLQRLGFTATGPGAAEKDLSVYANVPKIAVRRQPLDAAEYKAMKIDIDRAKLYLKMVKERLQLAYGDLDDEICLDELIYGHIGKLDDRILNVIQRHAFMSTLRPKT